MAVQARVREVFGYFQNLNLLALIQDLRRGQTARGHWASGNWLCPVAHGLPSGRHVREVVGMGQILGLDLSSIYAAEHIGADALAVIRFIEAWDEEPNYGVRLLRQLEELWDERLADADAVQEVIQGTAALAVPPVPYRSMIDLHVG
jgi:hypothetical protein